MSLVSDRAVELPLGDPRRAGFEDAWQRLRDKAGRRSALRAEWFAELGRLHIIQAKLEGRLRHRPQPSRNALSALRRALGAQRPRRVGRCAGRPMRSRPGRIVRSGTSPPGDDQPRPGADDEPALTLLGGAVAAELARLCTLAFAAEAFLAAASALPLPRAAEILFGAPGDVRGAVWERRS
jgi:hypothetical protein